MTIRFVIALLGAAITSLAVALLVIGTRADEGWFVLAFGAGLFAIAALPRPLADNRALTTGLLAVVVIAFLIVRTTQLVQDGAEISDAVVVGLEAVLLAVVLTIVRDYLCGLGRLVTSLSQPSPNGGYARVLDLEEATFAVESELARSRRHKEPLLFLELEGRRTLEFTSTRATPYLSPRSVRYLERLYVHGRLGELLAQHARRSDLVICERTGRYVVVSPGTDPRGALAMAQRVMQAARSELGIALDVGIAAFPDDGETFSEILLVASQRATGEIEAATARAPAPVEPAPVEPAPREAATQ
jgi:hypothetical protein